MKFLSQNSTFVHIFAAVDFTWKGLSPAPDTNLEIDSLDVLGENPSAWRKCGEINGETRPKVDV